MLNFSKYVLPVIGAGLLLGAGQASATLSYDDNVTGDVIFGSGNANGSFTVDTTNGIELGLRAKLRFNGSNSPENTFNSNGDGTYTFDAGQPPTGFGWNPGASTSAVWNFEWSINSDVAGTATRPLNELDYEIGIDFDPSAGTSFHTFDLINTPFADHAIGTNATVNGAGVVAADPTEFASLISSNNLAQNSWNMEFFKTFGAFDANDIGTYTFYIKATDRSTGDELAYVSIDINNGTAVVPEPVTAGLGLLGLGALSAATRRRR